MKSLITSVVVTVSLVLFVSAPSAFPKEKEHEEQSVSSSDVPATVQQAAEAEVKGGTIVRWEKEGNNYEAVIEKDGKQTGVEISSDGKVVSRHDEKKEHKEKGEKGEKY